MRFGCESLDGDVAWITKLGVGGGKLSCEALCCKPVCAHLQTLSRLVGMPVNHCALQAVLKEVSDSNGKIVLFIDEIHTVVGAGATGGAMDAGGRGAGCGACLRVSVHFEFFIAPVAASPSGWALGGICLPAVLGRMCLASVGWG